MVSSLQLASSPAPCGQFFGGATTADIGRYVCARDEPSKLASRGQMESVCRPAKLPEKLRGAAIMDAEALEAELNLVGQPACPVDMQLKIAGYTPPALRWCLC